MTTPITLANPNIDAVQAGEPCYMLVERNLPPPDFTTPHRYQLLQVLRGDKLVWFSRDMGSELAWPGTMELRVTGDGEKDTVAQMMDIADEMRNDPYWSKVEAEIRAGSTLVEDYGNLLYERAKAVQNQSTFGPGFTKQRNGSWRGL